MAARGRILRSWLDSPRYAAAVAVALLTAFSALAVTSLLRKSLTFDELGHLTGGATIWLAGDRRMFPQNGPFPQQWAALPVALGGAQLPSFDQDAWRITNVDEYGRQFLYESGNDPHAMLLAARLMMVPLGAALCVAAFLWSRRLFGPTGGLVTLALCAFSPTLLAHARLATSDVSAALGFTLALAAGWTLLHRITLVNVVAAAAAVSLLCLSKMSGLLIAPVFAILAIMRLRRGLPLKVSLPGIRRSVRGPWRQLGWLTGAMGTVLCGVWLSIWSAYGFRFETFGPHASGQDRMFFGVSLEQLAADSRPGPAIQWGRDRRLLPEAYLYGLAHVLSSANGHPSFLDGRYSLRGWTRFLPMTVLYKTPLPEFVVLGLAAAAFVRRVRSVAPAGRHRRVLHAAYRLAPLWVFLIVYWSAALSVSLNIGHRHVLPTYPVMFILCGMASHWLRQRSWQRLAVGACLVWQAVIACSIWPDYLAYFNPLAGGPRNGYRHLVDSSLDWGQDLPALRQYLDERDAAAPVDQPVYLAYFGSADPAAYGINARLLPGYLRRPQFRTAAQLEPGVYCLSATILQSLYVPAWGPWTIGYERMYRERLKLFEDSPDEITMSADPQLRERWREFESLRLARLCAVLRTRAPDDQVGYSILIYNVTATELERALSIPDARLPPSPVTGPEREPAS